MRLVILDRDGTINEDSADFVNHPSEWQPLPGALEAIARMNHAGWHVVVATNQSGLGGDCLMWPRSTPCTPKCTACWLRWVDGWMPSFTARMHRMMPAAAASPRLACSSRLASAMRWTCVACRPWATPARPGRGGSGRLCAPSGADRQGSNAARPCSARRLSEPNHGPCGSGCVCGVPGGPGRQAVFNPGAVML
jgi:hypothetical protein